MGNPLLGVSLNVHRFYAACCSPPFHIALGFRTNSTRCSEEAPPANRKSEPRMVSCFAGVQAGPLSHVFNVCVSVLLAMTSTVEFWVEGRATAI